MPFSVYRNSQWGQVKNAWVYVSSAWKPIKNAWVYVNSQWRLFFTSNTTPVTPQLATPTGLTVWQHNPQNGQTYYRINSVTNATSYSWELLPASNTATVTAVNSNGSSITYTANNTFTAGEIVRVRGTGSFDTESSTIQSRTSTTFTINKSAPLVSTTVSGTAYTLYFPGAGTHTATATTTQTIQAFDYLGGNLSPETTYFFTIRATASGYLDSASVEIIYTTPKKPMAPTSSVLTIGSDNGSYFILTSSVSGGTPTYYFYLTRYITPFANSSFISVATSTQSVSFINTPQGTANDVIVYGSSIGKYNGLDSTYLSTNFHSPSPTRYIVVPASAAPGADTTTSFTTSKTSNSISYSRIPATTASQGPYYATVLFKLSGSSWVYQATHFHRIDGSSLQTDGIHNTGYGFLTAMVGTFSGLVAGSYLLECRIYNSEFGYNSSRSGFSEVTV